jgi:hypothetical protein
VPAAALTLIGPSTAVEGTVTRSAVGEALITVAMPPLKDTAFWVGVAPKPLPKIDTALPTLPWVGVILTMAIAPS